MAVCKILRLECYRSDAMKLEGWTFNSLDTLAIFSLFSFSNLSSRSPAFLVKCCAVLTGSLLLFWFNEMSF